MHLVGEIPGTGRRRRRFGTEAPERDRSERSGNGDSDGSEEQSLHVPTIARGHPPTYGWPGHAAAVTIRRAPGVKVPVPHTSEVRCDPGAVPQL